MACPIKHAAHVSVRVALCLLALISQTKIHAGPPNGAQNRGPGQGVFPRQGDESPPLLLASVGGEKLFCFADMAFAPAPRSLELVREPVALDDPPLVRELDRVRPSEDPGPAPDHREISRALGGETQGSWGSLSSSVALQSQAAPAADVILSDRWQAEESWQLRIPGPVSIFGKVGAVRDYMADQELNITSQTGLAWKMSGWPLGEVQVRGGPRLLTYADLGRPAHKRDQPELFLEMQCRWPLPGRVSVEYQSTALPALTDDEHDRVDQDVRLAFPVGDSGQLRVGAKHSWENAGVPRPWANGMELYLGLALGN